MTHYTRLPATVSGTRDQRCARCGDPIIPGRYSRWVHRPTSHAYDHEARTSREAGVGAPPPPPASPVARTVAAPSRARLRRTTVRATD